MQPVVSISALAQGADWSRIKTARCAVVVLEDREATIALATCPTAIGKLYYYLSCPTCSRRARALFDDEGRLRCKRCHPSPCVRLHDDQRLSGGVFSRQVLLRARQAQRLEERLTRRGLDRNTRRRLRRRRLRLLTELEAELARQRGVLREELKALHRSKGIAVPT